MSGQECLRSVCKRTAHRVETIEEKEEQAKKGLPSRHVRREKITCHQDTEGEKHNRQKWKKQSFFFFFWMKLLKLVRNESVQCKLHYQSLENGSQNTESQEQHQKGQNKNTMVKGTQGKVRCDVLKEEELRHMK